MKLINIMGITPQSPDNDAIRELRDELKGLSVSLKESAKSTEKFTAVMFLLAVVQLLVAMFQLVLSFAYPDSSLMREWLGVFMVITSVVVLIYFGKKILK